MANNVSEKEIEAIIKQEFLDAKDDKEWQGLDENIFT